MGDSFIELECFEPAGAKLEFSREDLLGHSLALGGSGSGKTSRFVLPLLRKLILSHEKVGLVIFDAKSDGQMAAAVRDSVAESGRVEDLVVIDGSGEHSFDIFGDCNSFSIGQVDTLGSLLTSLIPRDMRNRYWEQTLEALLRQALRLLALQKSSKADYPAVVSQLIRYLLLHRLQDPHYKQQIEQLKEAGESQDPSARLLYDEVIATHRMWDLLDARTRSNLQSMAASLTGPMNTPPVTSLLWWWGKPLGQRCGRPGKNPAHQYRRHPQRSRGTAGCLHR